MEPRDVVDSILVAGSSSTASDRGWLLAKNAADAVEEAGALGLVLTEASVRTRSRVTLTWLGDHPHGLVVTAEIDGIGMSRWTAAVAIISEARDIYGRGGTAREAAGRLYHLVRDEAVGFLPDPRAVADYLGGLSDHAEAD